MSAKIAVGGKAPGFRLPRDGGGEVSLADFKGRKLVLYFYPKADTSGCTVEAKDFSRLGPAFARAGTAILGVSADPVPKLDKFKAKHDLTDHAGLGRDPRNAQGLRRLGRRNRCMGRSYMGILRNTYLIGPDGQIARIWEKVKVAGHAEEVLEAAKDPLTGRFDGPVDRPACMHGWFTDRAHFPDSIRGILTMTGLKSSAYDAQFPANGDWRLGSVDVAAVQRAQLSRRFRPRDAAEVPASAPKPRTSQRQAAPAAPGRRTDYTLAHAGRQFRLGPVTFWIAVGSLVIMAGWSLATGTYFAFHDDVLTRLIARQKEQQFAYEDRIAELRAQVDRITSRQLLNQEQFEQKLEQIMRRQSTLENRAPRRWPACPIRRRPARSRAARRRWPTRSPADRAKASPISDTVIFTAPPDREARLELRELPQRRAQAPCRGRAKPGGRRRGHAGAAADLARSRRGAADRALNTLEERFDSKAKRIRGVLADLGMDGKKARRRRSAAAVGGPFVPLTLRKDAGAFERQLYRIHVARANVDRLTRTLGAVPVRKPIMGEIDLSSGFGVRSDPFLGRPAMHTGLDFRSSTGDPVRATANGTVETAGWNGGYGKMVEIDHGNGFSTRYGHCRRST